jgi:hypothetical protein
MTWNAIRSRGFALSASSRAKVTNRCDGVPSGSEWNSSTLLAPAAAGGPYSAGEYGFLRL